MTLPVVSFVVVSFNSTTWLARCLPAIKATVQESGVRAEIIVIDNASEDGSAHLARDLDPQAIVIRNDTNVGFARANNMAIDLARGDFVATVNPDVLLDKEWLGNALAGFRGDDHIGSCATQLRFWSARDRINSAGISVDWAGYAQDRECGDPVGDVTDERDVFGASAGAALYRRTMLLTVGGFADAFFAYYEDVDLAWRCRRLGWRCRYVPRAYGYHGYSASFTHGSPLKAFLMGRNRVWMLLRNASVKQLVANLPWIVAYDAGVTGTAAVRSRTLAPLRGRMSALRVPEGLLAARKAAPFLGRAEFDDRVSFREIQMRRHVRDIVSRQSSGQALEGDDLP